MRMTRRRCCALTPRRIRASVGLPDSAAVSVFPRIRRRTATKTIVSRRRIPPNACERHVGEAGARVVVQLAESGAVVVVCK
jgi:hypothetical protein